MSRYKVGDTVLIREWNDMLDEYGISDYGSIDIPFKFSTDMRQYCGKLLIIKITIVNATRGTMYRVGYKNELINRFLWSEEMFDRNYFEKRITTKIFNNIGS